MIKYSVKLTFGCAVTIDGMEIRSFNKKLSLWFKNEVKNLKISMQEEMVEGEDLFKGIQKFDHKQIF